MFEALVHESSAAEGEDGIRSIFSGRCTRATNTIGMKSKVHPTYKTKYRVANWPAYDRALVRRGEVTLWLAPEAVAA